MKSGPMDKYDDLQIALNVARDNLKSLNDKIGRDQFRESRKRPHWDRDNGNGQHKSTDNGDKRPGHRNHDAFHVGGGGGGPGGKRPNVFTRLEPRQHGGRAAAEQHMDQAVGPRPKISSRVTKEIPRREDVVAAQSDEQSRARNKRMFGSLLGTLNKFCQDESRLKGRVEKKMIIEKKVEEQELRERETIKMERRNLFVDRKKKLMEVRLLEIKMERMQDLAVQEEHHKRTRQFIRTTAGPKIFFLPKVMNEKMSKLLEESQKKCDEELEKKREDIKKELVEVEERLQRELEKALEEKPAKGGLEKNSDRIERQVVRGGNNHDNSFGDEEREMPSDGDHDQEGEFEDEEEEEEHRPKLTSQIVKSHVNLSIKTNVQGERRHVLQSAANKKMIISVVNTFEGGGRRF